MTIEELKATHPGGVGDLLDDEGCFWDLPLGGHRIKGRAGESRCRLQAFILLGNATAPND
jgi:hypothetical protein